MERPFVCLIDDHHTVRIQQRFLQEFPQEHPVCHVLDARRRSCALLEPNRVPDFVPELHPHFRGHACRHRHCRDSPRLSATDDAAVSIPNLVEILGHLSCLSASRLSDNDDDLEIPDRLEEIVSVFVDGQTPSVLLQPLHLSHPAFLLDLVSLRSRHVIIRSRSLLRVFILHMGSPQLILGLELNFIQHKVKLLSHVFAFVLRSNLQDGCSRLLGLQEFLVCHLFLLGLVSLLENVKSTRTVLVLLIIVHVRHLVRVYFPPLLSLLQHLLCNAYSLPRILELLLLFRGQLYVLVQPLLVFQLPFRKFKLLLLPLLQVFLPRKLTQPPCVFVSQTIPVPRHFGGIPRPPFISSSL
mmetsp:Transcript_3318/g.6867  ORF Transcript_3318/g.6867 Transcript_3318/m.6867 type:complete len:354 (-) Transcript_3318:230-1291(-)